MVGMNSVPCFVTLYFTCNTYFMCEMSWLNYVMLCNFVLDVWDFVTVFRDDMCFIANVVTVLDVSTDAASSIHSERDSDVIRYRIQRAGDWFWFLYGAGVGETNSYYNKQICVAPTVWLLWSSWCEWIFDMKVLLLALRDAIGFDTTFHPAFIA